MQSHYKISRTVLAAGNVMEIWPVGDYSQHMPKGTTQQRVEQHWIKAGSYLSSATVDYKKHVRQAELA